MDICLDRGADLHMAHLMPLPLTVSCFSKIQIGATFLVLAHPGSPRKRTVKRVYVCMYFSFNYFKRCFWANSLNYDSTSRSAVTVELHYCDFFVDLLYSLFLQLTKILTDVARRAVRLR